MRKRYKLEIRFCNVGKIMYPTSNIYRRCCKSSFDYFANGFRKFKN